MGIKEIAGALFHEPCESMSCDYCGEKLAFNPSIERTVFCMHCRNGPGQILKYGLDSGSLRDRPQNPIVKLRPVPLDDETIEIAPEETYRLFSTK